MDISMSDPPGRKTPQKKVHLLDTRRGLPNLDSIGRQESPIYGTMVHSENSDKRPKRKERARKNLVDTLSAKRPAAVSLSRSVTYSFSDRKIPNALRQSGPDISVRKKDLIGLQYDPAVEHRVTKLDVEDDVNESLYPELFEIHRGRHSGLSRYSSLHKSATNLPQLIHDLNSSLKYTRRRDNSLSSDDDVLYNGEDILQTLSQNWSRRNKDDKHKHWLRHRPITPNLLENLDKLKMSSRSRTEQWVKQIPTEKRSYHSPLYRLGNVANDDNATTPAVHETWIYEESRNSTRGVRKPRQT